MADQIRFHLDEQMDPVIASSLRAYGVDMTTTPDQGLRGASDEDQLARSTSQGRVLVTDDTDLLRLGTATADHNGIVFCRRTTHTIGQIIQFLLLIHGVCEPDEMRGRIEFL